MPRYDFECQTCGETIEVERAIENRNRAPGRCELPAPESANGQPLAECGGRYMRRWTPVQFRVDR